MNVTVLSKRVVYDHTVRERALRKRCRSTVLALIVTALSAQTPPAAQSSRQPSAKPVSHAEEVVLDLVVHDKRGRSVSNLKPGEIEIIDGGLPVKIFALRLVNATDERLVTLVFDRFEPSAAHAVRNAALKTLKVAPGRKLSFSIFKMDGRFRLIQPFTTDREALTKAIAIATGKAQGSSAVESDAKGINAQDRKMTAVEVAALRDYPRILQDQQARPSLAGLLALARAQQSVPGRKAIVYFTQGMQVDSRARNMMTSIVGAANRSGVSIYAVDASGLDQKTTDALRASLAMTSVPGKGGGIGLIRSSGTIDPTPAGMIGMANEQMGRIEMSNEAKTQSPLAKLSTGTGGIYVSGTDGVSKPLRRMIQDLTTYYEASYASNIEQYDGRFRPVTVKPLRRGLRIQARSGYFALAPRSTVEIPDLSNAPALQDMASIRRIDRFSPEAAPASITLQANAPPLSSEELQTIVAGARQQALDYTDSLPNFICVEVTDRSMDPSGAGKWRHRDTIAELLRYHDKREDRMTLELNRVQSDLTREDLKGTLSHGEFGGLLNAVFDPQAKAEFRSKETDALGNKPVQVFTYRVTREKSNFSITDDSGRQIKTGFHGLVYIDGAAFGVRRITMEAEDLPPDFGVHSAALTVDYDYIAIGDQDYLLPVAATLRVSKGKRSVLFNEMEFREYRRYLAESHIQF